MGWKFSKLAGCVVCTTPKLITDYDTPFMFMNELSGQAFLNYKWFVESPKSISKCSPCFVTSLDTIVEFLCCGHYVPIERIIGNMVKHSNVFLKQKAGVAHESDMLKSKLYVMTSYCKHKKGVLFCSFFVYIRLIEEIFFFTLCYFSVVFVWFVSYRNHTTIDVFLMWVYCWCFWL